MQAYSRPDRESDPHALPDLEVFKLSAHEVAAMDDDLIFEFMKRPDYSLAAMNSSDRENMLGAMVAEENIESGWFYWFCFPGCLPDSAAIGPFPSHRAALKAAQDEQKES